MVADGVELGDEDVEVDGVDNTDAPATGVPEADVVALAGTTLTEGELDGEALIEAVGMVLKMLAETDALGDTEAVSDADGLALTMVLDGEVVGDVVPVPDAVAALADGVALAETVVTEGLPDEVMELVDGETVMLADTATANVGLAVGEPVVDGDTLATARLLADMLIDGVALIDTMLADIEGETNGKEVVDGVGEGDTWLGEGEPVSDEEALADGVALPEAMVMDGEALVDSDGMMGGDRLADNAGVLLQLALVMLPEGVVGCEGVTVGVTLEAELAVVDEGVVGLVDTMVGDAEGLTDREGVTVAEGLAPTMVLDGVTEVVELALTKVPDGEVVGDAVPVPDAVALVDGVVLVDTVMVGLPDALADTMMGNADGLEDVEGVTDADGLTPTMVLDGEALIDNEGVADGDGLAPTMVPDGEVVGEPVPMADPVAEGGAVPDAALGLLADAETVALADAELFGAVGLDGGDLDGDTLVDTMVDDAD
jgi:hypothetical protein